MKYLYLIKFLISLFILVFLGGEGTPKCGVAVANVAVIAVIQALRLLYFHPKTRTTMEIYSN